MKKIIFPIVIIAVLFFVGKFLFSNHKKENVVYKNIEIGGSIIKAEVATSEKDKEKGLSGRNSLPEDTGKLFVFNKADFYSFWMKEMNFPIDIIWIGDNLEIIGFEENLKPDSYPQTFSPPRPASLVLEINAGGVKRHGIKTGMMAKILSDK